MIMNLRVVAILSLLEVFRAYTSAANNPPMLTRASMDVGNIISIVIPESPNENINVEQLTGEFRQQLERIKKQSRASKVEHGMVALKRVLPEILREEKRKTLPLFRRVLHGRRVGNLGSMKNWTREVQRLEQMKKGGQLVRSYSSSKPEVRKIFRDYEEPVNREVVETQTVQSVGDKKDYSRVSGEVNADRPDEGPREDSIRRNEQNRQEELIHYEEQSHRDDRANGPDEDQSSSKIGRSRSWQEWDNQNWEDRLGDPRNNPETRIADNYTSDRMVRQKEPGNEILQNDKYAPYDRYDKPGKISELEQQISSRHTVPRHDETDNSKRYIKDGREYRLSDIPGFINYPREYDINEASNQDCDDMKRNNSGPSMEYDGNRDVAFDKHRLEAAKFAQEGTSGLPKIIQNPREYFEVSNTSGLENVVSESTDGYSSGKKRRHRYLNDFRTFSSIQSSPGGIMERWNIPNYDDRHFVNSSDYMRASGNVYEILAEKEINPTVTHMQTEQGNFPWSFGNEPNMATSQHFGNYHGNSRISRIRRALNGGYERDQKNETPKFPSNISRKRREVSELPKTAFLEQLQRLLKNPSESVLYANGSVGHNERTHKLFTEAAKSQSIVPLSMVEPTTSSPTTNHDISVDTKSTTISLQIRTNQ